MTYNWFCLWLGEAKQEFAARNAIKKLDMESFSPVEFKLVARNPRDPRSPKKRKPYPMCIRYAFVGFPDGAGWSDLLEFKPERYARVIRGTQIIATPVGMTPTKPTQLTQPQVDSLAALSDSHVPYKGAVNPHRGVLEVQVGQTARILSTALHGLYGRVDEVSEREARLTIEFLGSLRPVWVPKGELEAA